MKNPTVMSHEFSRVPSIAPAMNRSTFSRTHGHKTTIEPGLLYPLYVDRALPGDVFKMNATILGRILSPLKFPIMDNAYIDVHYFAIPYRLVYEFWEALNGQQENPDDPTDYLLPILATPASVGAGSQDLITYMGVRPGIADLEVVSIFVRAYNKVWNTWYRNQNLQDSVVVPLDEGPDTYTDFVLLPRNKAQDYFTGCLPWPQKGPDVLVPLGGSAPVLPVDSGSTLGVPNSPVQFVQDPGGTNTPVAPLVTGVAGDLSTGLAGPSTMAAQTIANGIPAANFDGFLIANLEAATASTINALRQAAQIQRLFELDATGGTRYIEVIKRQFGVDSPDARLQRPEYLGGSSTEINVHPTAATATVPSGSIIGSLGAFGTVQSTSSFSKGFTEHTIILGLVSVRMDLTYQQGTDRMFFDRTRFDHFMPVLENLGEQPVFNREIFTQGPAAINPETGIPYDNEAFGYQEAWASWKYKNSLVTGLLRSDVSGTLDVWTLAEDFDNLPVLGPEFIPVPQEPFDRAVAVPSQPIFIVDCYFKLSCTRPMRVNTIPSLGGRI